MPNEPQFLGVPPLTGRPIASEPSAVQNLSSLSMGAVGQGDYVVKQGDCVSSVAKEHGFFWETLWNHSANTQLKERRRDPNVLLIGDRVTVPPIRRKDDPGQTEKRHRFRRLGEPAAFKIRILKNNKPRANQPYRLIIDGHATSGSTDADGKIECPIPGNARQGQLIVGETGREQTIELNLGHLDPVDTISGLQARLRNLGFSPGQEDGTHCLGTTAAIKAFQASRGMQPTGLVDQPLQQALKDAHGS